jgi:polar amino acid transport system substrate-binding protein
MLNAAIGLLAVVIAGCAGMPPAPTAQERQALAPTGKLRVGLILGAPANVVRDGASGEMKGVGYDLGKELAKRIGVPFEPVLYPSIGAVLDAGRAGNWDVSFNGVTADRASYLDFTGPHIEIEFGYLAPPGSALGAASDVDRPGIRVAVPEKGAVDVLLSKELRNASVVRGAGLSGALALVKSGRADVLASNKPNMFQVMGELPGSRVLDGGPGSETQAMLMPKGRDAGAAYARKFIEDAKSEGLVKAAIERAGLRGTTVAASSLSGVRR